MTTKTVFVALALTLVPAVASAQCIHMEERSAQTSSCKAGTTWDATSASCVADPLG